jgi:hypothetical protein
MIIVEPSTSAASALIDPGFHPDHASPPKIAHHQEEL